LCGCNRQYPSQIRHPLWTCSRLHTPCIFSLINIYRTSSDIKCRRVSGFSKPVICCNFRPDAKMIIGGEEGGSFRICTTDRNTFQLRKVKAHNGSSNVVGVDFSADGLKAVSLGSDGFVKIWDISVSELQTKYLISESCEPSNGLTVSRTNNNLVCVGNFAGVVKLFDTRQVVPVGQFTLPCPVSALQLTANDVLLTAAAGQYIYAWDIVAGKPFSPSMATDAGGFPGLYTHYKLITGLASCFCPAVRSCELLLSTGMDKLLKITSLDTFEELHQERLAAPITGLGVLHSLKSVIVGCENGLVRTFRFVQLASPPEQRAAAAENAEVNDFDCLDPGLSSMASQFSGHWRVDKTSGKYMKAESWFSEPATSSRVGPKDWGFNGKMAPLIHPTTEISRFNLVTSGHVNLTRMDRILSRFEHSRALSASLCLGRHMARRGDSSLKNLPSYAFPVAVVRELSRRGTLVAAVSGRTDVQLIRLLRFIRKHAWLSDALPTCVLLYRTITDIYATSRLMALPEFVKVGKLFQAMSSNIKNMLDLSRNLHGLLYSEPSEDATVEVPAEEMDTENEEPASSHSIESLYHLVTEASLSPGYEAASILGCILMIFSAEMQRRFENSQKKTGPILCDGLGFGIPGLYSRQGMLALAQFLARVGFCVINVGHAYVNYVRKGSLIMVFFNAVISIPVLVGFHTRLFAILMATVMWIGFYVNYFTLLDDDRVFLQEYVWFKFAQTTSITGGLLMLALQGPGSYSVDAARNKDD
uniref:U3 small nucleolar RNA-associated protein 15 homolog n=1 Tax=Schistocephalus solidus TaxID=70667 RepID=A0A183SZI2_SCHSO